MKQTKMLPVIFGCWGYIVQRGGGDLAMGFCHIIYKQSADLLLINTKNQQGLYDLITCF